MENFFQHGIIAAGNNNRLISSIAPKSRKKKKKRYFHLKTENPEFDDEEEPFEKSTPAPQERARECF